MITKYMETLPTDIETLQALVRQLLAENAALKARIAELEARLETDSHNSHKPPSSDGLRKRPAFPKPRGRKKGGQSGHRGKTLTMVDQPDTTVTCQPEVCSCGRSLQAVPGTVIERRQVFDLPEPKLTVTEYQRLQCQCPECGAMQRGVFPSHVKAPTQYGVGVRAFATLLNTGYLLPFKKIQGLFADLFGYAINEGTLVHANTTAYEALAESETLVKAHLQASPVCHFDETGLRVDGTLHWQHVVSTASATYLFVHPKRGRLALTSPDSLLPAYEGWAVHDCWASYFSSTSCRHALCGAHLLRELTAVAEQGRQWATQMHTLLLAMYRHATCGTATVSYPQRWGRLYDRVCRSAEHEEPPPTRRGRRGKATRTKGRNLLTRLRRYKSAVLAFAFHEEVPFTNNQAERDLRPVKVKQKIAGCFRTLHGAQQYARIASFISTARKQHRHVFKELRRIFLGDSFLLQAAGAK
jgi:transposase